MGGIYIAGPECFLPNGYALWWSARKLAESKGFAVTMPTATPLKQDAAALRDNAQEIFDDLLLRAAESDTIIADLRSFRGPEPDGGTIFEMGMMKARGARLYGYDLTLMSVVERNPYAVFSNGTVFDEKGFPYPYASLPFPPAVYALATLSEGDFSVALSAYAEDRRKASMGIQLPSDPAPAADPDPPPLLRSCRSTVHSDLLRPLRLRRLPAVPLVLLPRNQPRKKLRPAPLTSRNSRIILSPFQ